MKHRFAVPLTHEFIGCFWNVPWLEIEPESVPYPEDAPTSRVPGPGRTGRLDTIKMSVPPNVSHSSLQLLTAWGNRTGLRDAIGLPRTGVDFGWQRLPMPRGA